jgi:hypothetical protein
VSEVLFQKYRRGFGCAVFGRGGARISISVPDASAGRKVTAEELRLHAATCLTAAIVLEGAEDGEQAK